MGRLEAAERMVLQAILDLPQDAAGFTTDAKIAQSTGITLQGVRDCFGALENDEYIEVARTTQGLTASFTPRGRLRFNKYQLFPDESRVGEGGTSAQERIRQVLAACYRRALYTRTHAQLSHEAMFASLHDCLSTLQKIVVYVEPEANQRLVAEMIGELDKIERSRPVLLSPDANNAAANIDVAKQHIITMMRQLAESSNISLILPKSLTVELFWSKEDADLSPEGPESNVG